MCAVSLPRPPSAYFRPQAHQREVPLVPRDSVLLFVDVQNYNCSRDGAVHAGSSSQVCACSDVPSVTGSEPRRIVWSWRPSRCRYLQAPASEHWWSAVAAAEPRWAQLRGACRRAGVEVMYTVRPPSVAARKDRSSSQSSRVRPVRLVI